MKHRSRTTLLHHLLPLVLLALLAGCSSRGVHMPKHRKQRRCNCPTFAQSCLPAAPSCASCALCPIDYPQSETAPSTI